MRDKGGEDLQLNHFFVLFLFSLLSMFKWQSEGNKKSLLTIKGFIYFCTQVSVPLIGGIFVNLAEIRSEITWLKTLAEFRVTSLCEKPFSNIGIRVSYCKTRVFPESWCTKLFDNLSVFKLAKKKDVMSKFKENTSFFENFINQRTMSQLIA